MSSINVNTIKSRLGGPPTLPSGVVVSAAATFSNDVSIGGTLTYEDVTNVDAVGLITARSGIKFGAAGVGGTITAVGNAEFAGIGTFGSIASPTLTGDVSIADKIIHTGDTNTALRFPSADTITAETAGSERLRITSAGSVGINTTTPDRRFTLYQDATCRMNLKSLADSTAGIEFGDPADHNAGYIVYDNTNNSFQVGVNGTGEKVRIDSTGNVGVNESNPAAYGKFVAKGTGNIVSLNASSGAGSLSFFENGTGRFYIKTLNGSDGLAFVDADGSSERLRIASSGNIGIGTNDPTATSSAYNKGTLHIHQSTAGASYGSQIKMTTTQSGAAAGDGAYFAYYGNNELYIYNKENADISFGTNAIERLRITSAGVVDVTGITSTSGLTLAKGLIQEKGKFESGGSPSGTFNHDVNDDGMIYRTSANMTGTFIFNLRGDGSTTFNSLMHIGQSAVFTAYTGSNNTSYYMTDFQIDGSSITEKWNGGSAPTAGTGSGTDVYTFNILKTADATFTVFATFSNFA